VRNVFQGWKETTMSITLELKKLSPEIEKHLTAMSEEERNRFADDAFARQLGATAHDSPAREAALLAGSKLSKLWDTPEEDAAWASL
jgi:hypothetical protein